VNEKEEASKIKYNEQQALKLLAGADKLISIKGKKVVIFDLKKDRPDDETLLNYMMGPTGNLRAPTARIGNTIVVGFNEEQYRELLGL
jgi:arsenate reductase-like glutaredoxin family protein